jgi:hypothetical protein
MNILFVTATRISDAVLSIRLLGLLVERYPGARLIVPRKRPLALHWLRLYGAAEAAALELRRQVESAAA